MNSLRLLLVGVAAAGFGAALAWHLTVLDGSNQLAFLMWGLLAAVFLVFGAAIVQLIPFLDVLRQLAGWRLAFAGAPPWLKWCVLAAMVYAVVNFFLATGEVQGTVGQNDPGFARVMSGHLMLFYAFAGSVLFAAYRREDQGMEWMCARGHRVSDPTPTCSQCGARVDAVRLAQAASA